jgi:guanosine-3',5'-bis(diphosphate) 3'-pyrophosphohydrolase
MEEVLSQVRDFADKAHGTQMRKYSPDRYIVHPVRVMEICRKYTNSICVLCAALLHDVLEDTPVREDQIRDFLHKLLKPHEVDRTVKMVVELTDVYIKSEFPHLNRKARKQRELDRMTRISAEAQTIKYADILDNSQEIVPHDPQFAVVFLKECRETLRKLDKGNKELYQLALSAVEKGLRLVPKNTPK